MDREANFHASYDYLQFSAYQESNGVGVTLEHDWTTQLLGKWSVNYIMTCRRNLTLQNVMYAWSIGRNLLSRSILMQSRFRLTKDSNTSVTTKNNLSNGIWFVNDGLIKSSVLRTLDNEIPSLQLQKLDLVNNHAKD